MKPIPILTRDRRPIIHEGTREDEGAQPVGDRSPWACQSLGFIPALYAPFALLSMLIMTLGKSIHFVLDKFDHFPITTFMQLCLGVFALLGYCDHSPGSMVYERMKMILVIGLALEQLPTNKKNLSPWWLKNKLGNGVEYIKRKLTIMVWRTASMMKNVKGVFQLLIFTIVRVASSGRVWPKMVRVVESMSPFA